MKDENKKAKKTKTPKEYTEEDLQNDLEKSGDFRKLYDMVFENGECIQETNTQENALSSRCTGIIKVPESAKRCSIF